MGALTTVTQSISCHISGCFGRLIDYEQHTSVEKTWFSKDTNGSPWGKKRVGSSHLCQRRLGMVGEVLPLTLYASEEAARLSRLALVCDRVSTHAIRIRAIEASGT